MILTSNELLEKLKEFEGLRLEPYEDVTGVLTIGYGHTRGVRKGDKISEYCAEEYLRMDIETAQHQVLQLDVCKTQGQLDALVSFVFNLGIGRLKGSTLLKLIEAGFPPDSIQKEFRKWSHAGGKKLPGLLKRRRWEARRYFNDTPTLEDVKERLEAKEKGRDPNLVDDGFVPQGYCEA